MRNWVVGAILAGFLAACGRGAPDVSQSQVATQSPAFATAEVILTAAAGGATRVEPETAAVDAASGATRTATPVAADALPTNIGAAEQTIRDYFSAFGARRAADAWALLAPSMQAGMTPEMFESTTLAVQSLRLSRIDSVRANEQRLIYGVTIEATPVPDLPTLWRAGANQRYVILVATSQGWRIAAISADAPANW